MIVSPDQKMNRSFHTRKTKGKWTSSRKEKELEDLEYKYMQEDEQGYKRDKQKQI